ncbi:MAG: hypothetical protein WAO55_08120 [Candidatus Manganitrophaceae bacterium]
MGFVFKEFLCDLRQLFFPKPFRVARSKKNPVNSNKFEEILEDLLQKFKKTDGEDTDISVSKKDGVRDQKLLVDIATRLWRIRTSLQQPNSKKPFEKVERGYRHLEKLLSVLEENGIRIVDKTGDFYDPGMSMRVVSTEPTEGIGKAIIKETVEPAVYLDDHLIQIAKIVLGIPVSEGTSFHPKTPSGQPLE